MVLRRRGNGGNIVLLVCVSIICGFSFTLWLQGRLRVDACRAKRDVPPTGRPPPAFDDVEPGKNLLFVGVMTARAFLDNRAAAVYATWGRTLPGKLAFFSSEGSVGEGDMPVVALPGVTDHYPPQKKSFMMLKYMYDHYVDKFEWFMRADDDVYIRGDKMEKFLRSVNSSKPQFIGQAGIGKKHELGKLG
ncbi:PREDICTED: chondroitin sulfate synthase 1-like [Priapulus caudatus]|uniref:Chondroitin sulfate synthase 1-like n=1 Tax=Priapulus caudatus TaxID=37621 RepID=A0ABM1E6N3_PRICU|nr:PREDICTED: chondroitin sulfate synthase 1-like [Priapulus caudatus]